MTGGDRWSLKWGSCIPQNITNEGSDAICKEGEAQPSIYWT